MSYASAHGRATRCRRLLSALAAGIWTLALACAPGTASGADSVTERLLEQRVKAAFIYRFTDFVVWPEAAFAAPDAPFSIAVVAKEGGLADDLRQIVEGRTAAGRRIAVRQVSDNGRVQPAHIVFVADSERHRIGQLVRAAPAHALIVTETPDALSQGSVVNFVIVDGRVRFDISLTAAERRGLRLSSRLLAVAHTVRPGGH